MMSFIGFLGLYDNWNGNLIINDKKGNLYANVKFAELSNWLHDHKTLIVKEVLEFGFHNNELCVTIDI